MIDAETRPDSADESAPRLLARVLHVARFILADRPDLADYHLAGGDLRTKLTGGRGVFRFDADDAPYIVFDHGAATTQVALPPWATRDDVQTLERPEENESRAWRRLCADAAALRLSGLDFYSGLRIAETVEIVGKYRAIRGDRPTTPNGAAIPLVHASDLAGIDGEQATGLLIDPEAARAGPCGNRSRPGGSR